MRLTRSHQERSISLSALITRGTPSKVVVTNPWVGGRATGLTLDQACQDESAAGFAFRMVANEPLKRGKLQLLLSLIHI